MSKSILHFWAEALVTIWAVPRHSERTFVKYQGKNHSLPNRVLKIARKSPLHFNADCKIL